MYEYKYVEATFGTIFTDANYHEIIDAYAKEGWKLVQVLSKDHRTADCEIIFERKIEE